MFIRSVRRFLLYGAIFGFANGVWQSGTAILKSIGTAAPRESSVFQSESRTETSGHAGREGWTGRIANALHEGQGASLAAFEEFRRSSSEFWMLEYEAELEAAEERVGRETATALHVAARTNAEAQRDAERVAETQLRTHYSEATRVASQRAAADAAWAARISREQSAADFLAAERIAREQQAANKAAAGRIAMQQGIADRRAAEIIVRQQTGLNRRMGEFIAREQAESNREAAKHRVMQRGHSLPVTKPRIDRF